SAVTSPIGARRAKTAQTFESIRATAYSPLPYMKRQTVPDLPPRNGAALSFGSSGVSGVLSVSRNLSGVYALIRQVAAKSEKNSLIGFAFGNAAPGDESNTSNEPIARDTSFSKALTLKLSRIAARSRAHGKLFLPPGPARGTMSA